MLASCRPSYRTFVLVARDFEPVEIAGGRLRIGHGHRSVGAWAEVGESDPGVGWLEDVQPFNRVGAAKETAHERISERKQPKGRHLRPETLWGFKPHRADTLGRKLSRHAPTAAKLLHLDPVEHPGSCGGDDERRGSAVRDPRSGQVRRLQECAVRPTQGEAAVGGL